MLQPTIFPGSQTPITDLLDLSDPKPVKKKREQTKSQTHKDPKARPTSQHNDKINPKSNKSYLARRPDHEQPSKFPDGLKRPDLDAVVDGNKIASEAQRQLYDDINAATARVVIKAVTSVVTVRNQRRNGKKNSIKKRPNIEKPSLSGNNAPAPPRAPKLHLPKSSPTTPPPYTPTWYPKSNAARHYTKMITRHTHPCTTG